MKREIRKSTRTRESTRLRDHRVVKYCVGLALVGMLVGCAGQVRAVQDDAAQASPASVGNGLPDGISFYTEVEGIKEYRLDNGLRVVLLQDSSSDNITVNITYLVGSRHEAYGETGMAHLLEHLVFKGTPNHPDIPAELTERGASPNGTTSRDRTNYFETFTATDDNLEWALDLESDRMVNSFIAKEDLESEMTVVRNEFESGENSPNQVLYKRVLAAAFEWHNYGNSVIGARADIENVPIERLQAFYRKYYQPDNAVLLIAGKIEIPRTLELVAEKFGAIPRPDRTGANQIFETYTAEPAQDGERTVTLRRVGGTQLLMQAYHTPSCCAEDSAAVFALGQILGSGPSSRLYKNLVETQLATSAYTYTDSNYEPGLLLNSVAVRPEQDLQEVEDALSATVNELIENPPTEEELNRVLTIYEANTERSMKNVHGMAMALSNISASGDWRLFFIYRDAIQQVTREHVHAAAKKYLRVSNRTTGYFLPVEETPERAVIEEAPPIASLVEGYEGREALAAGEDFDTSYENIEARTEHRTLSNGTNVAFLVKKTRGETVSASFWMPHGTEASLNGLATAGSFAGNLLPTGTTSKDKVELRDAFVALKSQGGFSGGLTGSSGSVSTDRENVVAAIRLVAEVAKEPSFLDSEFDLQREARLSSIESSRTDPQSLASIELNRHETPVEAGHPFYSMTLDEQQAAVEAVTNEDVRAFYENFYGAGPDAVIVVVGDFDADEVFGVLEEEFGEWTSEAEFERIPSKIYGVEALALDIEVPDKANAIFYMSMELPLNQMHEDYPAMVIANMILGGGFLNSRLATRIRQKDGLSYGVGAYFNAHPVDPSGSLGGYAIYSPTNADQLRDAFFEEIQKVLDDGFTQEELDAARTGWLDSRKRSRASDGTVSNMIQSNLRWDRTMDFHVKLESAVENLSVEDLNTAFNKYVVPEKISYVRAGSLTSAPEMAEAQGSGE